jgi:ATP-binding cassette subfamily F protein uup
VILAKLFTTGSNLLVLDEPTNDLDVETLEALESKLEDYPGTLIAVSHDRHFLDAVVTRTLVFEADGAVRPYVGGYSDWARHMHGLATEENRATATAPATADKRSRSAGTRKLSYKLRFELDTLPARIESIESAIEQLNAEIAAPDFYRQDHAASKARLDALAELEQNLATAMERWSELEQRATEAPGA